MTRRRRSQVGERISPWPVEPLGLKVNVSCPFCFRRSWLHRAFDAVPDGAAGYTLAADPWEPAPIMLKVMRQWPRKPDGSRGFYWENLSPREFETHYPKTAAGVRYRFAMRALAWLELMGVDVSSARTSEGLRRLRDGW